jgi:hypothetical protein
VSDAAGCANTASLKSNIGCGNVGFDYNHKMIFMYQLYWPSELLSVVDESGVKLCFKTAMLEFLGILLPFVTIPQLLANQYVIVKVDNIACFFGWLNKQLSGDAFTSLLIRVLHMICHRISCEVHIEHLPRMSTPEAALVDRLSRKDTTSAEDRQRLASFGNIRLPKSLVEWLNRPVEDWSLPYRIVCELFDEIKR